MKKDFVLKTKKGNILRASTYRPREYEISPCLVYVHGIKGFKDEKRYRGYN